MITQGDILTLEDNKDYVVIATTVISNVVYAYLMDENDYSNFMICSYDQTDGLYEVEDQELLSDLMKIFEKQISETLNAME